MDSFGCPFIKNHTISRYDNTTRHADNRIRRMLRILAHKKIDKLIFAGVPRSDYVSKYENNCNCRRNSRRKNN